MQAQDSSYLLLFLLVFVKVYSFFKSCKLYYSLLNSLKCRSSKPGLHYWLCSKAVGPGVMRESCSDELNQTPRYIAAGSAKPIVHRTETRLGKKPLQTKGSINLLQGLLLFAKFTAFFKAVNFFRTVRVSAISHAAKP